MIINEKGKLFGKINIIDLSVILILVLSVAAIVYKFGFSAHKEAGVTDTTLHYEFKIKAVRQMSVDCLKVGDEMTDWETGTPIGKIVDKRVEQAVEFVNMADGSLGVEQPIPNKFDVYLTIECDARVTEDGYYLNGTRQITHFEDLLIYNRDIDVNGTVIEIQV